MLKRIYINNFKCLSNFELDIDAINLFLGYNGVGKSTVFDALRKLRQFINADEKVTALFGPWLTRLWDICSDGNLQTVLISHHPEYINYLASSAGWWFYRDSNIPVRVKRVAEDEAGVPISELVARGWIDE